MGGGDRGGGGGGLSELPGSKDDFCPDPDDDTTGGQGGGLPGGEDLQLATEYMTFDALMEELFKGLLHENKRNVKLTAKILSGLIGG